jgi:predicted RNase H-like HicB family nuclease
MLHDYILSYLNKAHYEMIDNGKRYYGEIPELKGVWALGKTLESCRQELLSVLEGWIILRLRKNLSIPGFRAPRPKIRESEKIYA